VTPGNVVVFSGYTVLWTADDGSIAGGRHGLFHRDARVLSRYRLTLDGHEPELVQLAQSETDRWEALLRLPTGVADDPDGPRLRQDTLEVRLQRRVGPGMREWIAVQNHSAVGRTLTLEVGLDADFADTLELGAGRRQQGEVTRAVDPVAQTLCLTYTVEVDGRRDERGVRLRVVTPEAATIGDAGVSVGLRMGPRGESQVMLEYAVLDDGAWLAPAPGDDDDRSRQRSAWRQRRPAITCSGRLRRPFERAADDLFALRNWELERQFCGRDDGASWVLNAGVPTFTGLFGRDTLTAGWQSALVGPRAARGALEAVAATKAETDDPWRDAEPGKLIHELRDGPLSRLGVTPHDAYYGSQTTPAMFVLALSELWHWTADDAILRRHRDVALGALEWAERYGDLDGDGFLDYRRRSPQGLVNQGWKDSQEAIRHPTGVPAEGPIATVEEQAFHYLALERMAEILVALGEDGRAERFLARADDLARSWHAAYWMADESFYALALDGRKEQVRSVTSNPGHALGAGIVPRDHAARVADRLLAPDLFSGWGVRSLSDRHPSYNPFAYHLGAVWPVEQATFALGFKRYGLDDHVDRLVEAVFEATARSPDARLPEALTGHPRVGVLPPAPYPDANNPQAWSASALVQLVQIMLGIYPFAPLRVLVLVRPRLPEWLPQLTLRHVRVGRASVDLTFVRQRDGSARWQARTTRGLVLVVGAEPPDDFGGGVAGSLQRELLERVPGRLARAARIALGWR
jgi:glycogen debranching enzyme